MNRESEKRPRKPFARGNAAVLSPLRYPGSKRRLAGYIAEAIRLNGLQPRVFVEPFAGGASVALQLLASNQVQMVALGDRDPLIASFWKVVFNDPDWLVHKVRTIRVTLRQWRRFRNSGWRTVQERAIACLFLNRTSFSGILAPRAGPLGGSDQQSEYAIDCRFPRETLAKRILQAASFKDRIALVNSGDWRSTLAGVRDLGYAGREVLCYFDPPFYNKGDSLYRYVFDHADHLELCEYVAKLSSPWLASYDPAPEIVRMYSSNGHRPRRLDLLYSTASTTKGPAAGTELVITNLDRLPAATRLWRTAAEWKLGKRKGYRG